MPNRFMADVSSNNPQFVALDYRKAGHVRVGIKATEGDGYVNPYHETWTDEAHANNLAVLHYHFCTSLNGSYVGQLNHFWRTVRPLWKDGDLLCLDVEKEVETLGPVHLAEQVSGMANYLHGTAEQDPVLYMNLYYHNLLTAHLKLRNRWFWIAAYGTVKPSLPRADRLWAWQQSDGKVGKPPYEAAGIGRCDISELNLLTYLSDVARLARRR